MLCVSTALKIQVSGATADLLQSLRGYVLTCRGTLNVKVTLYSYVICLCYIFAMLNDNYIHLLAAVANLGNV